MKDVEKAMGRSGTLILDGVYKFSMLGSDLNVKVGNDAIAGDFVLTSNEVNPVIKDLGDNDISVTAIHNYMINENHRLFFLHFWATGDQSKLASGLKEASNKTNSYVSG